MSGHNRQPVICTFRMLSFALAPLHVWNLADVDRLHDVWKMGAPTPDSIVRNPVGYDPRKAQQGNVEKRIVLPSALEQWVQDVATRRGISATYEQAAGLIDALGRGFDAGSQVMS